MALSTSTGGVDDGLLTVAFDGTPAVGNNQLIAAPTNGTAIRVYAFSVVSAGGDNAVYWKTGSTSRYGGSGASMTINQAGPNVGFIKNLSEKGHFSGAANEALNLYCSTTEALFGDVVYKLVPPS